ncbi:DEAD/DEAH box helicase [Acinetobacter sp. Root1280]|uniref:DEAD/DEAH box helicase n=1 Tax=Acinetobacter sp. Root1280 TaxID=1736444 RepID=UPI00222821C0|nr:DEAD/DEAH box helicase family protein [Acinetobacter sp. Root1280]
MNNAEGEKLSYFKSTPVNILGNNKLRNPQLEAYIKIQDYFTKNPQGEALVVLPTGTGKSGLISIAPFDVSNGRVLIITPGLVTKDSINKTQSQLDDNFWINYEIIFNIDHQPIINEYETDISQEHLDRSNIVISNIQKVVNNFGSSLVDRVPKNYFDMIIIDESHHSTAESWQKVLDYFTGAKKLHVTGTPYRGDNQPIPGDKIHETSLSEVMRSKYVKFLKKETVNSAELYFTINDRPGEKLTLEEVLELKDRTWIEKSVALSTECSLEVVKYSVSKLNELKQLSPQVPHKILAAACSIDHAESLVNLYKSTGLRTEIIHSEMDKDSKDRIFKKIENHQCDVVISVNMLMEGYDHKYLTLLSLFRPYRSLNAFAQIVGRVLRVISDEEITDFDIDNNATVIFHEEIGLNHMWSEFQKEIDRSKVAKIKEYTLSDFVSDTERSVNQLAEIQVDGTYISSQESFLTEYDFNALFEARKAQILSETTNKKKDLEQLGWDPEQIKLLEKALYDAELKKFSKEIDPELLEKRPHQARKTLRKLIKEKIDNLTADLLSDLNIDPKGTELAPRFSTLVYNLAQNTPNDGTIVRYIQTKLHKRFGAIDKRDNETLKVSLDIISEYIHEVRRLING